MDTQGLMGHVRLLSLHPAYGGKPLGAFRQVFDVTDTNTLAYKPTHAPDTSAFSPTHLPRSCHLHPHPQRHTPSRTTGQSCRKPGAGCQHKCHTFAPPAC